MDATLTPRILPAAARKDFKFLTPDRLVSGVSYLPPAFDLIPRLLLVLENPDGDCDDLAQIIRVDPGLTAHVFRAANSATFRGAQKANSLMEAILRLGMREVFRLIMEIVTAPVLEGSGGIGFGAVNLWRHSLATAVAARTLARHLTDEDGEVVFTAGLLHDIGKVILGQELKEEYAKLLEACAEMNAAVYAAERDSFLLDHTEAAHCLLRAWKFPDSVVAAVYGHHQPQKVRGDSQRRSALVYAGNVVAYRIREGNGYPSYVATPDESTLKLIDLDAKGLFEYEGEVSELFESEQANLV